MPSIRQRLLDFVENQDRKWQCRLLKDGYDECKINAGVNHPMCKDIRKSMIKKKCDECLKADEEASGRFSLRKRILNFADGLLKDKKCKALKDGYDECKSNAGVGHPMCQDILKSMIKKKCDECLKADEEASGRFSLRKRIINFADGLLKDKKCKALKDGYDECKSNAGVGHPMCQDILKSMIKKKCDECLKADEEASGRFSLRKRILNFADGLLKDKKCKALKDGYDECKSNAGVGHPMCQDILKSMIKKECDGCVKADLGVEFVYRGPNCKRLKEIYDKCILDKGYEHRLCQVHRKRMSTLKCHGMENDTLVCH